MSRIESIFLPHIKLQPAKPDASIEYGKRYLWNAAEQHKFSKATYNTPKKSNMTYVHDHYFDELMIEAEQRDSTSITDKWFEKGTAGHTNGKTGRHVLIEPSAFRTTIVIDKLKNDSFLPSITLQPHMADMSAGETMAQHYRYDEFGSAPLFSGGFRGSFLSQIVFEDHSLFSIIVILHIGDEPLFRTREFNIRVDGADIRTVMENIDCGNIELIGCYDGFANFGTNYGRIWHNISTSSHSHVDDFKFMTKGRRCFQFQRRFVECQNRYSETFRLTRYPAEIELYLNLLYACQ